MYFILKNLGFTLSELVLLQSVAHCLLLLLLHQDRDILCGDTPRLVLFRFRSLLFLLCCQLSRLFQLIVLGFIPLRVDLPLYILVEFLDHLLQLSPVTQRDKGVIQDNHHNSFQLASAD